MQSRHLPNEPDAAPADSQSVQRRRRRRRDDRDALNSGGPPENIRPVPQRRAGPERNSASTASGLSAAANAGSIAPCWGKASIQRCAAFATRSASPLARSTELINPAQCRQALQFPSHAHADQAEPGEHTNQTNPTQDTPTVKQRTHQPSCPEHRNAKPEDYRPGQRRRP